MRWWAECPYRLRYLMAIRIRLCIFVLKAKTQSGVLTKGCGEIFPLRDHSVFLRPVIELPNLTTLDSFALFLTLGFVFGYWIMRGRSTGVEGEKLRPDNGDITGPLKAALTDNLWRGCVQDRGLYKLCRFADAIHKETLHDSESPDNHDDENVLPLKMRLDNKGLLCIKMISAVARFGALNWKWLSFFIRR